MDVSAFRRLAVVAAAAVTVGLLNGTASWARSKPAASGKPKHGRSAKPKAVLDGATVSSIAQGLDNPRGLSFGPNGTLYVAEAGNGGSDCLPATPPEEPFCVGFTGGIAEIGDSGAHRLVSGIVSFAEASGFGATGLDGVSAHGNGGIYGVITESVPGLERLSGGLLSESTIALAKTEVGRLIKANQSGNWRSVAAVGNFDFRWTEEHFAEKGVAQPPDSNPYGVLAEGGREFVADAASNIVDEVSANGSISVLAFIPSPPVSDSVPTCVARGPDGALYVGELTGFGNGPGKSIVWRLVPGQEPEQWATGLTAVTGCGFGSDGQFYAVEFSTLGWESFAEGTGAVVRVAPHSSSPTVVAEGLSFPNGFAAGPDGSLYVSNWSIAPAETHGGPSGEVVRITP